MVSSIETPAIIGLVGGALLGGGGAWGMARWAGRLGLVDLPGERRSHRVPTPRGGGIGILLAACCCALLLGLRPILWCPAVLVGAVSFWDDCRGLSPSFRLSCQLLAALSALPFLEPAGQTLSWTAVGGCIFVIGTANFFNFMDGINGMAGLSGAMGFALLGVFSWFLGNEHSIALFSWSLALACSGFLPFNFPRAKVFLGDVGSIFLGFQFGLLVLVISHSAWEFVTLAGTLAPIYFDALLTLVRRWRRGENLFQAHRQHLYQFLVHALGWRHWQVSALYGLLQLVIGMLLLLAWYSGHGRLGAILLALSAAVFVWVALRIFRIPARFPWPAAEEPENLAGIK